MAGTWKDFDRQRQLHGARITQVQVRNIADVATAIAKGDLSSKITVEVKGEILALKNTINTMVDQLNALCRRSQPRGATRGRYRWKTRVDKRRWKA